MSHGHPDLGFANLGPWRARAADFCDQLLFTSAAIPHRGPRSSHHASDRELCRSRAGCGYFAFGWHDRVV